MLEKLLEKKKKSGKDLDPIYKDSKMSMLKALRDEMSGLMKNDLQNGKMSKVEVSAESPDELKAGLDTAEDMLAPSEDASNIVIGDRTESSELSPEEIEQLEMLLGKLKKSKSSMI